MSTSIAPPPGTYDPEHPAPELYVVVEPSGQVHYGDQVPLTRGQDAGGVYYTDSQGRELRVYANPLPPPPFIYTLVDPTGPDAGGAFEPLP